MDRPLGPRQPDKRVTAYESIFGRPSVSHHLSQGQSSAQSYSPSPSYPQNQYPYPSPSPQHYPSSSSTPYQRSPRQSIYGPPLLRTRLGPIQTTRTINPNTPNRPFLPFPTLIWRIPMTQPTLISNPLLTRASPIRPKLTITAPPPCNSNRDHGDLGRHHRLSSNNSPPTSMSSIKMALRAEAYPTWA
jgi:hypothetical protein